MTIDDRARAAARSLHDEVGGTLDTERALEQVLAARRRPRRRRAVLAAAAAVALLAGTTLVLTSGDGGRDRDDVAIDVEPKPDDAEPDDAGGLQLLGPDDGRASRGLPVAVDPATDLDDEQVVHVEASGFVPGETVGVVQCSSDAQAPVYAGVDACNISQYTSLVADADGAVEGEYTVHRLLTSPYAGTIDCAAAAGRCIIGVGALSDYDRSGGTPLGFTPVEGELVLPTLELSVTTDLVDAQVVHVSGSGFTGDGVGLQLCSASPVSCWQTGSIDAAVPDFDAGALSYPNSLDVADDGTIDGDVPVWRFLPGDRPGTYVDCAVSTCSLRVSAEQAPSPVLLSFADTDDEPVPATLEVTPSDGVHTGDTVTIRGTGFTSTEVYLNYCGTDPATLDGGGLTAFGQVPACAPLGDGDQPTVGSDGSFELTTTLGAFDGTGLCSSDLTVDGVPCGSDVVPDPAWTYVLFASSMPTGTPGAAAFPAPTFEPSPVVLGVTP